MSKKIDYAMHYLRWHRPSESHMSEMRSFYQGLLDGKLPPDRSAQVVDIGCGMGFALLALKEMGYVNVQGLEIDPTQAEHAAKNGVTVHLLDDSSAFLKDRPESFDLALCLDVLEHVSIDDQQSFLQSVYGSLMPGGRLIATVPNANSALAGRWRYIDWTHVTSFTESSLEFLLRNAGFDAVLVTGADVKQFYRSQVWSKVAKTSGVARLVSRCLRRIDLIGELGWEEGLKIPLNVNILAVAKKKH